MKLFLFILFSLIFINGTKSELNTTILTTNEEFSNSTEYRAIYQNISSQDNSSIEAGSLNNSIIK